MQNFVDLLHDGAKHLIELEGRRERFAQLMENGDFASFGKVQGEACIPAPFDTLECLGIGLVLRRSCRFPLHRLVSFLQQGRPSIIVNGFNGLQ
jgi:hypothetical protein